MTRPSDSSVSIGGRSICNLRIADDIDLMSSSNGELQDLTNSFVDKATAYRMEVSTEKSKIITNSMKNISPDTSMNGQKLEEVTKFEVPRSNCVPRWHLLSGSPHQDCLSNGSNG